MNLYYVIGIILTTIVMGGMVALDALTLKLTILRARTGHRFSRNAMVNTVFWILFSALLTNLFLKITWYIPAMSGLTSTALDVMTLIVMIRSGRPRKRKFRDRARAKFRQITAWRPAPLRTPAPVGA